MAVFTTLPEDQPSPSRGRRRGWGTIDPSGQARLLSHDEVEHRVRPPISTNVTVPAEGSALTRENLERAVGMVSNERADSAEERLLEEQMRYPQSATRREVMQAQITQTQENASRMMNQYADSMAFRAGPAQHTYASLPSIAIPMDPLSSLVVSKEEAMESFPPDKDWQKLYKSKKPIEDKVAHILIHSSQKIEEVQKTLFEKGSRERDIRRAVREAKKQTSNLARDIRELKKKKRELEAETTEEKEQRAHNVVLDVLKIPGIRDIEVDEKKRIFITTDEIMINKDYWKEPRNAGKYQILVDFYQPHHSIIPDGVRVLNITKRFLEYDHPCIKDTHCCWGTIAQDIVKDFKDRDLLELVVDLLLYISSPKDDSGWITYSKKPPEERHKQGWEQFLEFAKPMPKNFSFLKYEKQKETYSLTDMGREVASLSTSTTSMGIGAIANYSTIAATPSRLPPLIVGSPNFMDSLKRRVMELIEARSLTDQDAINAFIGIFVRRIQYEGMLFIRDMRVENDSTIRIVGWNTQGERVEMMNFPLELAHQRLQWEVLRFQNPSWFREPSLERVSFAQIDPTAIRGGYDVAGDLSTMVTAGGGGTGTPIQNGGSGTGGST